MEWLKLNFASCVIHQTRSLGVLILYFFYNMCGGRKLGNVHRMVVTHVSMEDPTVGISYRGTF